MEDMFGKPEIRLKWNEKKGLEGISIGASGSLDLSKSGGHFTEHNLGTETSPITGAIAINYVHELLKIQVKNSPI